MSWFPIVYISSDNSSDEEIRYCSDSDELSVGWSGYFPATSAATASSTNKRSKKKTSAASAPSLEEKSSDSEWNDPTFTLSSELP